MRPQRQAQQGHCFWCCAVTQASPDATGPLGFCWWHSGPLGCESCRVPWRPEVEEQRENGPPAAPYSVLLSPGLQRGRGVFNLPHPSASGPALGFIKVLNQLLRRGWEARATAFPLFSLPPLLDFPLCYCVGVCACVCVCMYTYIHEYKLPDGRDFLSVLFTVVCLVPRTCLAHSRCSRNFVE